jgi:LemA protein
MSTGSLVLLVLAGLVCLVLVLLLAWGLGAYNRLVRQRNQVETVKGYAAHERGTLDAVVQARNTAVSVAQEGTAARAQAENALTQTLGRLFALAEAYPNLKANENFLGLQGELATTEDKIAYARQFFNSAVQTYNTSVQSIPTNIVAGVGGFRARELFQTMGEERGPVQVRF